VHTRIIRNVVTLRRPTAIVGIDPSLRGHAMALVLNDRVKAVMGWTDKKTLQRRNPDTLCWFKMRVNTDRDQQHRCALLSRWTIANIAELVGDCVVHVAMEGYAFSKNDRGNTGIHELCGAIKLGLWHMGIPLRIYDPLSVKLAWTNNGHADKEEMKEACLKLFGWDFERQGSAGADLADAVLIANLLHVELEVRAGRIQLEELRPSLRRVLLRVTKSEPEALITRPFIHPDEVEPPAPILGGPAESRLLGPSFGTIPGRR